MRIEKQSLRTIGCLLAAVSAGGCSQQLRPVFEAIDPPIVWPPAPAPARIRYVGEIRSSADLKPPPKPFQGLSDALFGAEPPEPLFGPRAVVCSGSGSVVWVADPGGRCVHRFDLETRQYRKVQKAGVAQLVCPVGLSVGERESIYVCDSEGVAIHRFEGSTGAWIETLRLSEDIRRPAAVSYNRELDELLVVDVSAHDIKVLDRGGGLRRIIGRRGEAPGEFNFPCDLVEDGDRIWVVDAGNHRVQAVTRTGEPVARFGQVGDSLGDLALPKSIALDSDGHLYVVDARFESVQIFDRAGQLLLVTGEEGTGPGEFWLPAGISIDGQDRIWVCDSYNRRLQVFEYLKEGSAEEGEIERRRDGETERGGEGGTGSHER